MFEQADIRPEARPEELGIEQWGRLADAMRHLTVRTTTRSGPG